MKSKNRWIEIQFAYLCFSLYDNLKDYVWTVNYLEMIAEIAHLERGIALRLLQKVNQINSIRPSNTEYICIARQNKQTIAKIMEVLNISKKTYIHYSHLIDLEQDHQAYCSETEINDMKKLLEAHQKIKDAGI